MHQLRTGDAQFRPVQLLPKESNAIVVLDLSASISSDTFNRIGETLDQLAATNGRYGLIVFSDVAYQALPPGTPSAQLRPFSTDILDAPGRRIVQLTRDGREVARFTLPRDLPAPTAFFVSEGLRVAYTAHGSKIATTDLSR